LGIAFSEGVSSDCIKFFDQLFAVHSIILLLVAISDPVLFSEARKANLNESFTAIKPS
jgi:hypothetical protein